MSTTTVTHHHVPMGAIAAAAAVVAIALGGVAFSIAHDSSGTVAPNDQHQPVVQSRHGYDHFQPTTSGGRVMIGS